MSSKIYIFLYFGLAALPAAAKTYLIDPDNTHKTVKVLNAEPVPVPRNVILMKDPIMETHSGAWQEPAREEEIQAPVKAQAAKFRPRAHRLEFAEHNVIAKTIKPRVNFDRKSLPVEPDLGYHEVKNPPRSRLP